MESLTSGFTIAIKTKAVESIPPNPERTKDAFSRIGYSLEESIADLIDNSIDAGASDVLIRLVYDRKRLQRIFVVDNGRGMREVELRHAMQFGSTMKHKKGDLGKYGIGLKAASLSQCEQFAVITRSRGELSGRRWSSASFKKDWLCEKLEQSNCAILFASPWAGLNLKKSGTIIMWENLMCLRAGDTGIAETMNKAIVRLSNHLGLVFHRFLEKNNGIRIHLDSQVADTPESKATQLVSPFNPFKYPASGARGYPKEFQITLDKIGDLTLVAHIWPPKSRAPGYILGGGKVSSRQGFYFYRNNRLIQAGGWNGYRGDDTEPHVSLARVSVDISPTLEGHFDVMVQKSKVSPPINFVKAVGTAAAASTKFFDYVSKAIEVYRQMAGRDKSSNLPLVPWNGISPKSRDKARDILARKEQSIRKIGFRWENLDVGTVFELDQARRRIKLNERYRKSILGGSRKSKNDAEMFKTAIFLLVHKYFDHHAITSKRKKFLDTCNRLFLHCIDG